MISVIIPAFNIEKYIIQTLTSLRDNYEKGIEIIIINDGSSDETVKLATEFKDNNKEMIIKIISVENGGVSRARNIGIENATREYIMFLDGDDLVINRIFDQLLNEIVKNHNDIYIYGYYQEFKGELVDAFKRNNFTYFNDTVKGIDLYREMILKNTGTRIGAFIIKRKLIDNIRFNEKISYGEDIEFISKCIISSNFIKYIKSIMMIYRVRENSAINSDFNTKMLTSLIAMEEIIKYVDFFVDSDDKNLILSLINVDKDNIVRHTVNSIIFTNNLTQFRNVKLTIERYALLQEIKLDKKTYKYIKGYRKMYTLNYLLKNVTFIYFILMKIKRKVSWI